ncbi:hypothetical protein CR203_17195 [Salipaludibacillus neizhouensis]|uniref:DUF2232 domain-containing protein n=1 Tax=Salipaludibacillus neizhouensis TaxID=885475 RepID=A0A3A9KET3_9BACI|nr:YybS family protein [Salipaludibacillus neizhouensis]RKL66035.1 hypothetical protein CR203_17195 [Salipaludibacillus neizhouensis]
MDRSNLLREGGLCLGLFLILTVFALWIPVLGLAAFFFLSIPFIYFTFKYELKAGISLALIAFSILFILLGPSALPIGVFFLPSGVIIGELYRRKKEAFAVLVGGALSYVVAIVFIFIAAVLILNVDPVAEMQAVMLESVEMTEQMMPLLGEAEEDALQTFYDFVDSLSVIAPSLMVMIGVGFAFTVQVIASFILRKKGEDISRFPPFRDWGFPKAFIWYYLITYLFMFGGIEEGTALYTAVSNLSPVLEMIMIIQGFALVFFYFHYKGKGLVFPIIVVVMSFLLPFFLHIIRILGIIDLGFDLRKRMNSQK